MKRLETVQAVECPVEKELVLVAICAGCSFGKKIYFDGESVDCSYQDEPEEEKP
jgi:hypothetical protein